MKSSDTLIEAIKKFEGCKLNAYKCPAGVWTIGYGHTQGVKEGQIISRQQAEQLLKGDILPYETFVNSLKISFTQGQFDALVDFAYNCGIGNLQNSTLLKKIRACAPLSEVQAEFHKWVFAAGKKISGLTARRKWEANRYADE